MTPKLAIFDFDGTLVDSEPNYGLCTDTLFAQLSIQMTAEKRKQFIGISTENFSQILVKDFNLKLSVQELVGLNDKIYMDIARKNTPVFPAMFDLLQRLNKVGIVCAIASGSSLVVLEELIDQCGLRPYIQAVFSAEQVKNGKPAPDIFLHTANELGFLQCDSLVFEDSIPGVFAAHQAHMQVVAVPPEAEFAHPVFQSAWLTYPGPQLLSVKSLMSAMKLPY
ncbi:MAG: HAD family hydrolase [Spirochaetia bacterium]